MRHAWHFVCRVFENPCRAKLQEPLERFTLLGEWAFGSIYIAAAICCHVKRHQIGCCHDSSPHGQTTCSQPWSTIVIRTGRGLFNFCSLHQRNPVLSRVGPFEATATSDTMLMRPRRFHHVLPSLLLCLAWLVVHQLNFAQRQVARFSRKR